MNGLTLQFTPFLAPVLGAAIALTFLVTYAWRQSKITPGTGVFLFLLGLSAWWGYTYALELITTDPAIMLFWVKLEWIAIALLPVAWLLFALAYAGYAERITLRLIVLLVALPAVMIVLAWTTPVNSLLYIDPGVQDVGGFIVFDAQRGPAFYVHVIYSYSLILFATWLIIRVWHRSTGTVRQLALVVAAGALLPILGNMIYQIGLAADLPIYVDITVPTFALSALLFALGWFRLRLFELLPELGASLDAGGQLDPILAARSARTRSVNLTSLALSVLLFLALAPIFTLALRRGPNAWFMLLAYSLLFVTLLWVTARREMSYQLRAVLLSLIFLGLAALDLLLNGLSVTAGFFTVTFIALAAIMLPLRLAGILSGLGLFVLALAAPVQSRPMQWDIYTLGYLILSLAMSAGILMIALVTTRRDILALLRISRNLSQDLEMEREQLEAHVAERTRALETSAAVSRQLSTILDQSRLVREVVEQLGEAFSYYHVHIYLWDEELGAMRLVAGTGQAGQAMLVMGHTMRPDQGLVGRAYSTNAPALAPDVNEDPDWLPNRLLPGTQAELAVPITYGEQVLGVLDVQDSEIGGLGAADSQLLQTIAGQMAVALRNARLLTHIQQEAEQEALINAIHRRIAQTTDIDGALRVTVTELTRALGARDGAIVLELSGANGHDH